MTSSEPLASHLADNYGWDEQAEGCNIWSIAPRGSSAPNLLVDRTQGVQYLEETKDGVVTGFQHVARDVSGCAIDMCTVKSVIHYTIYNSVFDKVLVIILILSIIMICDFNFFKDSFCL